MRSRSGGVFDSRIPLCGSPGLHRAFAFLAATLACDERSGVLQTAKRAGGMDPEELRDYGVGAQILTELGVQDMVLLTNSHHTLVALDGYGLSIVGERPIPCSGDE